MFATIGENGRMRPHFLAWLAERCEPRPGTHHPNAAFYADWTDYIVERGGVPGPFRAFSLAMGREGFPSVQATLRPLQPGKAYHGVALVNPPADDAPVSTDDAIAGAPPLARRLLALRRRLGLSQADFDRRYPLGLGTIRNVEQGMIPRAAAQCLIAAIERDPDGVEEAIAANPPIGPTEGSNINRRIIPARAARANGGHNGASR